MKSKYAHLFNGAERQEADFGVEPDRFQRKKIVDAACEILDCDWSEVAHEIYIVATLTEIMEEIGLSLDISDYTEAHIFELRAAISQRAVTKERETAREQRGLFDGRGE